MRRIEPAPSSNPEGHHHDRLRKRLIVLALLVGGALLLMSSDALHGAVSDVVTRLEPYATTHRPAAVALFALLAAMSALLTFFSSTVIVPVAVQAWGAPVTAALLWSGWLLGGAGAYAAGRWLGRPIVRGLAGAEKLRFYQERFGRHTPFGVVLLFHLALQSEVPALVLGTLGYRFRLFFAALALAELPYAVGVVYLGSAFLERRTWPLLLGGVLAVVAAVWAVRAFNRALAKPEPPEPRRRRPAP